jgi:predicted nucleic acid-binding protein
LVDDWKPMVRTSWPALSNHGRADELFGLAQREAWRLVTTNAVVFETHALLLHRSRSGRETALRFLDAVQADTYDVVRVRKNDEEKAIAMIRAHEDKLYSLCGALSFVVMKRADRRGDSVRPRFPHLRQICTSLILRFR